MEKLKVAPGGALRSEREAVADALHADVDRSVQSRPRVLGLLDRFCQFLEQGFSTNLWVPETRSWRLDQRLCIFGVADEIGDGGLQTVPSATCGCRKLGRRSLTSGYAPSAQATKVDESDLNSVA